MPGATEPFAINNSQQVVFNVETKTPSQKRAYLFLQTAASGLVPGCHDLHALAGFDPAQNSGVHDINDAGLAVGWATFLGEQHAVVWRINEHSGGSIPFNDLGLLDLVDSTYSTAFAINDEVPPIIVGEGDVFSGCFCNPADKLPAARGFWVAFDDPPPLLFPDAIRLVHGPGCKPITSTRDVNTTFQHETVLGLQAENGNRYTCANVSQVDLMRIGVVEVIGLAIARGERRHRDINQPPTLTRRQVIHLQRFRDLGPGPARPLAHAGLARANWADWQHVPRLRVTAFGDVPHEWNLGRIIELRPRSLQAFVG